MVSQSEQFRFAEVILPLALPLQYTYGIPEDWADQLKIGNRVVVQLGKQKMYSGIIYKLHNNEPGQYQVKPILSVLDQEPVVNEKQLQLWEWISEYYLCTLGEVMAAALPSSLRLESETKITLNPEYDQNFMLLNDQEYVVAEALDIKKELTLKEISSIVDRKNVFPLVQSLIQKNVALLKEEMLTDHKTKKVAYVKRTEKGKDDDFLKTVFDQLEKRSPRQLDLLMSIIKLEQDKNSDRILQSDLLKLSEATVSSLNGLIKKEVVEIVKDKEEIVFQPRSNHSLPAELNPAQLTALQEIKNSWQNHQTVLLHGVTSSGKTEIYIHLINEQIKQGKQVLYLLPEIALTTQIISRLKKYYGDNLLVYHSRHSERERSKVWSKLLEFPKWSTVNPDAYQVIIGARSALFLPYSSLGLVIVDEEHENSFKQVDPAPRYHGRDAAIVLAKKHAAKVILGSATPAIETYFNAKSNKYGLVNLTRRHGDIESPEISVINIKELHKRKMMKSHFSPQLLDQMTHALTSKEQVILFQNRRGFAPVMECHNCGWIPHCINCDVSLTYYKKADALRCHYCGYTTHTPSKCNACGDHDIRLKGFGTEKIEDELSIFFPSSRIARLDLDATRSKHAFKEIISSFENREIDIMVGTQMVTKGLDFDNVSTVGILNADNLVNFPNFRSFERSYQLMAQVAGRAGRKNKAGKVIIQSFNPGHSVIQHVLNNKQTEFYEEELTERKRFAYPPYYRLIELRMKHRDEKKLEGLTEDLAKELKQQFGKRVLGPVSPVVARIKNFYLKTILIKVERETSMSVVKKKMITSIDFFKMNEQNRQLIIQVDVDPV